MEKEKRKIITSNEKNNHDICNRREIGFCSEAEGCNTAAIGDCSHSEGCCTKAIGTCSHSEGCCTKAKGDCSHSEGKGIKINGILTRTTSKGKGAHAEGAATNAVGDYSHAEGTNTTAAGAPSHAEGTCTLASGSASHAEGERTEASGENAHAEGENTIASGQEAHAEGLRTLASGDQSHAEGGFTIASGLASHAEGSGSDAIGSNAHAEGMVTLASGNQSHAEGVGTTASGDFSHAEGNSTTASGLTSHAEGQGTQANGSISHTEGVSTIANGDLSHAEGDRTITRAVDRGAHIMGTDGTTCEAFAWHMASGGVITARIRNNGTACFAGTEVGTAGGVCCPDYAEMFETADGGSIDVGYFVTFDNNEKIRKATSNDGYILGVTSATPGIVLGTASSERYVTDKWGRVQFEDVIISERRDESGRLMMHEYTMRLPVPNPEYKCSDGKCSRRDRPEWVAVGLIGQILVRDDGTCRAGGYCRPNDEGIATSCEKGYRVLKRIDSDQVLIMYVFTYNNN